MTISNIVEAVEISTNKEEKALGTRRKAKNYTRNTKIIFLKYLGIHSITHIQEYVLSRSFHLNT